MEFLQWETGFWARLIFERGLAALYFMGFMVAYNQFPALLGEHGLQPVTRFLKYVRYQQAPSLFHWRYSDKFLRALSLSGMVLSLGLVLGLSQWLHPLLHVLIWLYLYGLYLSITNVGQTFYGFGWESMLCEAGFFMAFMGPEWMSPGWIPVLILRWMLFRTELGAGLIKIRGDACWKDNTALYYHHETQPMPNPLSRTFHHLPKAVLRQGVVFSHFVQLVAPFGLFLPQPIAAVAGGLIIVHQLILVVGGNYSWLNWITIFLGVLAIDVAHTPAHLAPIPEYFLYLQIALGIFTLYLSYQPLLNLISKKQKMNYCWNRYHLVGAYGAFGSVTKKRYEIVVEGSADGKTWLEYEFKAKPTRLNKTPPQFAPYHLRLDWLMWFLPFSVIAGERELYVMEHEEWFLRFVQKLLQNDPATLRLMKTNPFPAKAPLQIRCQYYHYEFTSDEEFKRTKELWKRKRIGTYLQALTLESFSDVQTPV